MAMFAFNIMLPIITGDSIGIQQNHIYMDYKQNGTQYLGPTVLNSEEYQHMSQEEQVEMSSEPVKSDEKITEPIANIQRPSTVLECFSSLQLDVMNCTKAIMDRTELHMKKWPLNSTKTNEIKCCLYFELEECVLSFALEKCRPEHVIKVIEQHKSHMKDFDIICGDRAYNLTWCSNIQHAHIVGLTKISPAIPPTSTTADLNTTVQNEHSSNVNTSPWIIFFIALHTIAILFFCLKLCLKDIIDSLLGINRPGIDEQAPMLLNN